MKKEKILSSWWKRIIFFSFLSYIIFLITDYFASHYINNISYFYYDLIFPLFIAVLITSIFTERLRCMKYLFTFGISFTKRTFIDIFYGFLFVIIPFSLLALFVNYFYFHEFKYSLIHYEIIYFTLIIFVASAFEELVFRGIIFQALLDKFGIVVTLLFSSLIFSSMHLFNNHFNIIAFINTFLAGLIFGIMYIQTKSLYLPITYHFFWNYLQELLLNSNISGNSFDFSIFSQDFSSLPILFFGGLYGFEGGLIATSLLIITGILVFLIAKQSPYITSKLLKRKIIESIL